MPLYAVKDGTGANINYEVHPNLVPQTTFFIHGNLASNRWWYPAQEFWQQQAVGKSYHGSLIYAEFRGCGHSSVPSKDSEIDMHRFADDFIALIKNLDLGPVNLVGHSTGGIIVPLMMTKAPQLFNKAILLDPVGAQGVKFDNAMIKAFNDMKVNKELVGLVLGSTIYHNDPASIFFNEVIVEDSFAAVKNIGHLVLKALDNFDVRAEVSKITHPVLVLHGEFDTLLKRDESEKLAGLMKNAQFRVIAGQGHCMNVEAPEKFVGLAQKFLF
jgi:pimeloyl-ACP methyl ester carboxylesterase